MPEDLVAKGLSAAQSAEIVRQSYVLLVNLAEINPEIAEPPMRSLVEAMGFSAGQVFGILRMAVTGQKVSPPLFESIEIIGRETEARLAVSGCASLIDKQSDYALIFDIGGGSSEFVWLNLKHGRRSKRISIEDRLKIQDCIEAWTSLPFGASTRRVAV